jgi:hypothetical protein
VNTRQGTWGELKVGTTIQDKGGVQWLIAARDASGGYRIESEGGHHAVLKPKNRDYPMTIVEPTTQQAIDLVREGLGGTAEAYQDEPGGGLYVGPFTTAPAKQAKRRLEEAQSHMFLLHGIYTGDVKDYAGQVEAHEASHGDHEDNASTGDGYVPHIHRG